MSRRLPNEEQDKAICHNGGVVLTAGAGSGKTFVLVEHIIYLLNEKFKGSSFEENDIKVHLSSLVLITFTKKAASEILIRLKKRIEIELEETEDKALWKMIFNNFMLITVGTIHSFCFKLIKQGLLVGSPAEYDIVDEVILKKKIEQLFDDWVVAHTSGQDDDFLNKYQDILASRDDVLNIMYKVMLNPDLRIIWSERVSQEFDKESIFPLLAKIFTFENIEKVFHSIPAIESSSKKAKWRDFLYNIQANEQWRLPESLDDIKFLMELLSSFRKPPAKSLGDDHQLITFFERVKNLKEVLKKYGEDFIAFYEHYDACIEQYRHMIGELFSYIDKRYFDEEGIGFSDIEYIVYRGLQVKENLDAVKSIYKYIIVDEFQDTSDIQFKILGSISNNWRNTFFVGDFKQAIYGFRGGDVSVFEKAIELSPRRLSLVKNYRSAANIVNFNNEFFNRVLLAGQSYIGMDRLPIEYEAQNVVAEEKGEVCKWSFQVDAEFDSREAHYKIEAKGLIVLLEKYKGEERCLLYKTLLPSRFLIEEMIANEIPFVAQLKLDASNDPIAGLFIHLLNLKKMSDQFEDSSSTSSRFLLEHILSSLSVKKDYCISSLISTFSYLSNTIDSIYAFKKVLFDLGISNSNYQNNSQFIELVFNITTISEEMLYEVINNRKNNYSVEFSYGGTNNPVQIMSAHASKGLEFEHVFLAGTAFNSMTMNMERKLIGKYPDSFKWKKDLNRKKYYVSPQMVYEEYLNKERDFGESKRLFYVACTRAVSGLHIIDVSYRDGGKNALKNSWLQGLNVFESELGDIIEQKTLEVDLCDNELLPEASHDDIIYSRVDNYGVLSFDDGEASLGISGELSVTRVLDLIDCPYKFFIQNICRISEDDIESVEEKSIIANMPGPIISSKERGTDLHYEIYQAIIKKEFNDTENELSWIFDQLRELDINCLVPEREIKFDFFGQMISGTPDLIILDKIDKTPCEIWDYKTGGLTPEKLKKYQTQLLVYAMGVSSTYDLDQNHQLSLKVMAIDEQKTYERVVNLMELKDLLFPIWNKIGSFSPNTSHCSECSFRRICQYN